ncbi:HlyD family type I secretion periplasmic adaptor subunit [Magnetococcales bacterium HHB-1]
MATSSDNASDTDIKEPLKLIQDPSSPPYYWLNAQKPSLDIRRSARVGDWALLLFFGFFLGWAAFAPLDSAAIATGNVVVHSNRKTVKHLEGGIVEKIWVGEGDFVKKGDKIISLNVTQPMAQWELLKWQLREGLAQQARLIAERDRQLHIHFPSELTSLKNPRIHELMQRQKELLYQRRDTIQNEKQILEEQENQLRGDVRGIQALMRSLNRQIILAEDEVSGIRQLYNKKLAAKPHLLRLERQVEALKERQQSNRNLLNHTKKSIQEVRLKHVRVDTQFQDRVAEELQKVFTTLQGLQEKILVAEDVLTRTDIIAPIEGQIVGLKVHTISGVIAPGEALLEIVPSQDKKIIEARVNPDDIDVVHKGLIAHVRLTALAQRDLVPLKGIVESISADAMMDEQTGEPFFQARIKLQDIPKSTVLHPGMRAEVMIIGGERTLWDYLMTPVRQVINKALVEQ